MKDTIKKLLDFCEYYHCDLQIRYYDKREVCMLGINSDEEEVFNICLWYRENNPIRIFYFELNSINEKWRGGQFTKEDILLLLSLNDLSNEQLGIEPQNIKVEE